MRYIDADAFKQKLADKDIFFPALYKNELDEMPTVDVVPKSEVVEEYRKKVYRKMEKYTVFGREYIQRIMREVEKEMVGDKNA